MRQHTYQDCNTRVCQQLYNSISLPQVYSLHWLLRLVPLLLAIYFMQASPRVFLMWVDTPTAVWITCLNAGTKNIEHIQKYNIYIYIPHIKMGQFENISYNSEFHAQKQSSIYIYIYIYSSAAPMKNKATAFKESSIQCHIDMNNS